MFGEVTQTYLIKIYQSEFVSLLSTISTVLSSILITPRYLYKSRYSSLVLLPIVNLF